jgi:hypothetical protein
LFIDNKEIEVKVKGNINENKETEIKDIIIKINKNIIMIKELEIVFILKLFPRDIKKTKRW